MVSYMLTTAHSDDYRSLSLWERFWI